MFLGSSILTQKPRIITGYIQLHTSALIHVILFHLHLTHQHKLETVHSWMQLDPSCEEDTEPLILLVQVSFMNGPAVNQGILWMRRVYTSGLRPTSQPSVVLQEGGSLAVTSQV